MGHVCHLRRDSACPGSAMPRGQQLGVAVLSSASAPTGQEGGRGWLAMAGDACAPRDLRNALPLVHLPGDSLPGLPSKLASLPFTHLQIITKGGRPPRACYAQKQLQRALLGASRALPGSGHRRVSHNPTALSGKQAPASEIQTDTPGKAGLLENLFRKRKKL